MTRYRGISPPKYPIRCSTTPPASHEIYLRVVSEGTSYTQSRLAFHPYTQVNRMICTSIPDRSSTLLSKGFNLPTHSSTGFGYLTDDSGRLSPLPSPLRVAGYRFPYGYPPTWLTLPSVRTPWPVFRNGRYDTGPPHLRLRPLHAISVCSCLVSGSFHLPRRVLFSVLSRY